MEFIKTLLGSLIVLTFAGLAMGGAATTQADIEAGYSSTGQIVAIGPGTLVLLIDNGQGSGHLDATFNEKTRVVLFDGQPGKLSDLKIHQQVKAYWKGNPADGPILKIELIK